MPPQSPRFLVITFGAIALMLATAGSAISQQKQKVKVQAAVTPNHAGIFAPAGGLNIAGTGGRVGTVHIVNNSTLTNYFSIPGAQQEWIDNNILMDTDGTGAESVSTLKYTYCSSDVNPNGISEVLTIYDDSIYCAGPSNWPVADCAYSVSGLPGAVNGALACWIVTLDLAGVECNLTDGHGGSAGWGQVWDNSSTGPWLANGGLGQTNSFTWFDWNVPNANAFQGCYWFGGVPHAGFDMQMLAGESGVQLRPGDGIEFRQLDALFNTYTQMDTGTGQVELDIPLLQSTVGMTEGFLNVATSEGWVVHNLPVAEAYTESTIAVDFFLSGVEGVDFPNLLAYATFTAAPLLNFTGQPDTSFAVNSFGYNAAGRDLASFGPLPPPEPLPPPFKFELPDLLYAYQPGHSNEQAAANQCGPMATANSMDWLAKRYPDIIPGLPIHKPGLGVVTSDGTIVGELDENMARIGTSRTDAEGVGDDEFLEGKLEFIDTFNIPLDVKHQDDGPVGGGDFTRHGLTSKGKGNRVTWEFIMHEIEHGEDVELGWTYPGGGGHWVTLTGAGKIKGVPFVTYLHDTLQTDEDPNDNKGLLPGFSFLEDTNGDGMLNASSEFGKPEVDIVVSESPKASPEGPTYLPDPLIPNQSSRLYVKNLEPGNPTYIGYSLAGAGPTSTPFGDAWLGQPYQAIGPFIADANGEVDIMSPPIPAGAAGITVWSQALEILGGGVGEFSNPQVQVIM
ncbi:MAG: hypothetical protein HQ519_09435 [Planctomycetes bacterium]|nr:hypothetical protein [Planctomycetota bacterium]